MIILKICMEKYNSSSHHLPDMLQFDLSEGCTVPQIQGSVTWPSRRQETLVHLGAIPDAAIVFAMLTSGFFGTEISEGAKFIPCIFGL